MRTLIGPVLMVVLASCGSQHEFAGDARFQKHRHRQGWHLSVGSTAEIAPHEKIRWMRSRKPERSEPLMREPAAASSQEVGEQPAFPGEDPPTASLDPTSPSAQDLDIRRQDKADDQKRDPQPVQDELPARTKWNWFAVSSPVLLILALALAIPAQSTELLLIGCAVALAAALIGARQCRDRGERGQGFALAVLGFAAAGVLIAIIALLTRL